MANRGNKKKPKAPKNSDKPAKTSTAPVQVPVKTPATKKK
jgi:hypothetical protein